jgi:hypothetical protein
MVMPHSTGPVVCGMSLPHTPLSMSDMTDWWLADVSAGAERTRLATALEDLVLEDPDALAGGVAGVAELVCRTVVSAHRADRLDRAIELLAAAAPGLGHTAARALETALEAESARTGRRRPPGADALRCDARAVPLVRALGRCHGADARALPVLSTLMARSDRPVREAAWRSALPHLERADEVVADRFLNHLYGILMERDILTPHERGVVLSHPVIYRNHLLCRRLIALGRSRPDDAAVIARVIPPGYAAEMLDDGVTDSEAHAAAIAALLERLDVVLDAGRRVRFCADHRPLVRLATVTSLSEARV